MQLKYVTKEEAKKWVDEYPYDRILVMDFNKKYGTSNKEELLKKDKTKKIIDKTTSITMSENEILRRLDLEGSFNIVPLINSGNIVKTILFPKLE